MTIIVYQVDRHPGMELNLSCGRSSTRLDVEHDRDEIFGLVRDGQPVSGVEPEVSFSDSLEDLVRSVERTVGEWRVASQHDE